MSEANVETVRRWLERGYADLHGNLAEAIDEHWERDADYYPVRKFPDAAPRHGRDEIAAFMRSFTDGWDTLAFVVVEITGVSDDRVLVHANMKTEGRGTHLGLEGDIYFCAWLRHGRFYRWEDHLTEAGALHALGIEGAPDRHGHGVGSVKGPPAAGAT